MPQITSSVIPAGFLRLLRAATVFFKSRREGNEHIAPVLSRNSDPELKIPALTQKNLELFAVLVFRVLFSGLPFPRCPHNA